MYAIYVDMSIKRKDNLEPQGIKISNDKRAYKQACHSLLFFGVVIHNNMSITGDTLICLCVVVNCAA